MNKKKEDSLVLKGFGIFIAIAVGVIILLYMMVSITKVIL